MPTIKVDIRDFSKEWAKAVPKMREAMGRGLLSGVLQGQVLVMQNSPVDTGLYQSSWDTRKISDTRVQLGNSAPHAPVIEYGARPHRPPLRPLLAWAKRVLKDPSAPPNYSPNVWKLARGTQNKIAKYGQPPKRILTNAIPNIVKFIKNNIRKELDAVR
jgi:hypothetical protein